MIADFPTVKTDRLLIQMVANRLTTRAISVFPVLPRLLRVTVTRPMKRRLKGLLNHTCTNHLQALVASQLIVMTLKTLAVLILIGE